MALGAEGTGGKALAPVLAEPPAVQEEEEAGLPLVRDWKGTGGQTSRGQCQRQRVLGLSDRESRGSRTRRLGGALCDGCHSGVRGKKEQTC